MKICPSGLFSSTNNGDRDRKPADGSLSYDSGLTPMSARRLSKTIKQRTTATSPKEIFLVKENLRSAAAPCLGGPDVLNDDEICFADVFFATQSNRDKRQTKVKRTLDHTRRACAGGAQFLEPRHGGEI